MILVTSKLNVTIRHWDWIKSFLRMSLSLLLLLLLITWLLLLRLLMIALLLLLWLLLNQNCKWLLLWLNWRYGVHLLIWDTVCWICCSHYCNCNCFSFHFLSISYKGFFHNTGGACIVLDLPNFDHILNCFIVQYQVRDQMMYSLPSYLSMGLADFP